MSVTKVAVDHDAWAALTPPAVFVPTGDYYRFILPERTDSPMVLAKDGFLQLTLDRSSYHRVLHKYLTGQGGE